MRTVHKHHIPLQDEFTLLLPAGARALSFQAQADRAVLWVLVDADAPLESRRFRLVGTRHPIGERDLEHVGSVQLLEGGLVFHLFEVRGG